MRLLLACCIVLFLSLGEASVRPCSADVAELGVFEHSYSTIADIARSQTEVDDNLRQTLQSMVTGFSALQCVGESDQQIVVRSDKNIRGFLYGVLVADIQKLVWSLRRAQPAGREGIVRRLQHRVAVVLKVYPLAMQRDLDEEVDLIQALVPALEHCDSLVLYVRQQLECVPVDRRIPLLVLLTSFEDGDAKLARSMNKGDQKVYKKLHTLVRLLRQANAAAK